MLGHLEEREDEVVDGMKLRMQKYKDADKDGYVGRLQDETNEEMMQYLDDVGQDEQMRFDRSKMNVEMTLAMMKSRSESMRKSAESRERILRRRWVRWWAWAVMIYACWGQIRSGSLRTGGMRW